MGRGQWEGWRSTFFGVGGRGGRREEARLLGVR